MDSKSLPDSQSSKNELYFQQDSVSKNKVECVKGRVSINLWPTQCIYGPTHWHTYMHTHKKVHTRYKEKKKIVISFTTPKV